MHRRGVFQVITLLFLVNVLSMAFAANSAWALNSQGWDKTYGGLGEDEAHALVQTNDGGYALAGSTRSYGVGGDFWLVKTDANGNAQWNMSYGGAGTDSASALVQTSDGGYALAGSLGLGYTSNYWLVKTDSSGNMQWNKTYGTGSDYESGLVKTGDGGYALTGYVFYSVGGGPHYDFWLVKTDSSGNMQWNKTYGGKGFNFAYDLVQTSDGGYALVGYTNSFGTGNDEFWLVKTDSSGNMQWNMTYGGGAGNDHAYSVIQTGDGGYALVGTLLVKTDANGNMQWNMTYGTSNDALVQTSDGGYALAGTQLVKTDANGNIQWNMTYGGPSAFSALIQTTDGGFAIAGTTGYNDPYHKTDFRMVKIDANGVIPEFPSTAMLLIVVMSVLLAVTVFKQKRDHSICYQETARVFGARACLSS